MTSSLKQKWGLAWQDAVPVPFLFQAVHLICAKLYINFDFGAAGQGERASAVRKEIAKVCSTLA
jgi:hypothetical protein